MGVKLMTGHQSGFCQSPSLSAALRRVAMERALGQQRSSGAHRDLTGACHAPVKSSVSKTHRQTWR